jgi:TonB-dependent starch-binding outer membrane protein SusC
VLNKFSGIRITWLLITFITFQSEKVWSQDSTLSLLFTDITIQELLNEIENQTDFRFFYNNDEVNVSNKINIHVSNKSITETLTQAFINTPYSFRDLGHNLILIEAKAQEPGNNQTEQLFDANQPRYVAGRIYDSSGTLLPGVTVFAQGTKTGTITDARGEFSMVLPPEAEMLTFSFVGMRTQIVSLAERNFFEITMLDEAIGLEEIVVIGYGTIKKSDLTGSVAIITSDALNKTPSNHLGRALQGRASGLLVTQTGVPGGGAQIRVRGVGSINQNSLPVYVIDGVITGSLASIDPVDIESIQVLKDASAAAIYGADGANGVIIVTTRRGEKGSPRISLSSFYTINRVPRQFNLLNADEYSNFYTTLLSEKNITVPVGYKNHFREWYYGDGWQTGTNWQDEITRIAYGQNHSFRVSGGGDESNYSVSVNYFNEEGILLSSAAERISLRANSDFKIGKFIKIGETLSLSRLSSRAPSIWQGNPWQISLIASPLMRVHNEHNKGGFEGPQIPYEYVMPEGNPEVVINTGFNDKVNPRGPLEMGDYRNFSNNILASVYLEFRPIENLTFRTMPSVDASFLRIKNWFPAFDLGVRSNNQAQLFENFSEGISLSLENQVTFSTSFKNHNFTTTTVHHVRKSEVNNIEVTALGFPYEQLNVISQSFEDGRRVEGYSYPFASESYLGRIIYDYKSKYLLTASLRRDGNSRFGPENRWGTFPSLSLGWKVNDDFFTRIEEINMLKLRFGWGITGNSDIGNFQYMSLLDGFNSFSPVFGIEQRLVPALNVVHSFGNPLIKWEAAEMSNFGIDLNLFNNRIQLSAEYYIKNQDDLLVKIPMSAAFGRVSGTGDPWVNLGEIQNRGFEFSGIYRKTKGSFNYNISANLTTLKNEVKYLPGQILAENNLTAVGHTIGSFYGYVAERILTPADFNSAGDYLHAMPATGKPSAGDLKFKDLNNDGKINDLDRTIIGKAVPDFVYSLNFEFFYKNFDFTVFLHGMQNMEIYNHLRAGIEGFSSQDIGHNKLKDYALNYYTPERPSTEYIRADINNTNQNDRVSNWFLENGSFLRLKDLQLGFTIPKKITEKAGIGHTRIFLSATNIYTFTAYSGRDPESPGAGEPLKPGNDHGAFPVPRSVTGGINVSF